MKRDVSTAALIRGRDTAADCGRSHSRIGVEEEEGDEEEEEEEKAGHQAFQVIIP